MQCYPKCPQINPCFTEAVTLILMQLSKASTTLLSLPGLLCHFWTSVSGGEATHCASTGPLISWGNQPKVSKRGIFREPFFIPFKTLEPRHPKWVCLNSCAHAKGPGDTALLHSASDGGTRSLPPLTASPIASMAAMCRLCPSSLIRVYDPPE